MTHLNLIRRDAAVTADELAEIERRPGLITEAARYWYTAALARPPR